MKRMLFVRLIAIVWITAQGIDCQCQSSEWTFVSGHCFRKSTKNGNFNFAQTFCAQLDAQLMIIKTAYQFAFLQNSGTDPIWVINSIIEKWT